MSQLPLRIIPLGGMGKITQNMYVYEMGDEMMIVDCGIGFPDLQMPGVDILIPDVSYLLEQLDAGKKIVGMLLSHGHDDHIAATGYVLGDFPEFPIYASPLTAAFARTRMRDQGLDREVTETTDRQPFKVGSYFEVESIAVTHSVPDTKHLIIRTPQGVFYHGADFKLDPSPVDNVLSDFERMKQVGDEGITCVLMDCLNVEQPDWIKSETTTGPAILQEMQGVTGAILVTLMSSHIHRIQQTIDAAHELGRKIAFVGRSVEQNVEAALSLGLLDIPKGMVVDKRDLDQIPDREKCIIIAGSQGQEGSSLVRAIYGEHPVMQIKPADKVIFSASVIPGNEVPYYSAVDELSRNRVDVVYPRIVPDLHQSGHGSAPEQKELVNLLHPKYLMPIGGADRHRVKFHEFVAEPQGYSSEHVLIPKDGQVIQFQDGQASFAETIRIQNITVDGLGIGDVGPVVLADRRSLSESGIILLVIPRVEGLRSAKGRRGKSAPGGSKNNLPYDLSRLQVVSRGFVFMKEADDVIKFITDATAEIIADVVEKGGRESDIKQALEKRLGRRLQKVIRRMPMILTVFV